MLLCLRWIAVLAAISCCSAAEAAEIVGKVEAVAGDEVTIAVAQRPAIGDRFEVFVEVPGVGPAVIASGSIIAVDECAVRAAIEQSTGRVTIGREVRIHSATPTAQQGSSSASGASADDATKPAAPTAAAMELLGASFAPIEPAVARFLDVPGGAGLLVGTVAAGTPADASGLKRDVVLKADGSTVTEVAHLLASIAAKRGAVVELSVWRDGREVPLSLDPRGATPAPTAAVSPTAAAAVGGEPLDVALPTDLGEAARRARRAVVMLVARAENGNGMGSGFVISRKHRLVATNAHVADMLQRYGNLTAVVNEAGTRYRCERAWFHPGTLRTVDEGKVAVVRSMDPSHGETFALSADLAVLQLSSDGPELPAELMLSAPEEVEDLLGRSIGLLGFPSSDSRASDEDLDHPQASYQQGVVSRLTDFQMKSAPSNRQQFVQHTALGVPGASGSPIFLTNGRVAAVHNSMRRASSVGFISQISHGVRIDCLWELLAYHKLTDKVPIPVDAAALDVARFDRDDPELAKYQKIWSLLREANRLVIEGRYAEAGERCNEAVEIDPDYPYSYGARQEAFVNYVVKNQGRLTIGQLEKLCLDALDDAEKFVELLPTSPWALSKYALALNNVGAVVARRAGNEAAGRPHYETAVEICDRMLRMNGLGPTLTADAYSTRGVARLGLRQLDDALTDVNEAVRLAPNEAAAYQNRALVHAARGDARRAQADRARADELARQAAGS